MLKHDIQLAIVLDTHRRPRNQCFLLFKSNCSEASDNAAVA